MKGLVAKSRFGWMRGRTAYAIGVSGLAFVLILAFALTAYASTPPTVPANVQVSAGTTSPLIATVTWAASTDDIAVTGYRVWRAVTATGTQALIGSTVGLRFDDITGVAGQNYFYAVSAFDGSGLESTRSAMVGPVRSTWVPQPHTAFSVAENTCRQCHVPHQAATQRGLLRHTGAPPSEVSVCYSCHDGSGATTNIRTGPQNSFALASGHTLEERVTGTRPADADRCSSCHEAHADSSTNRMLPRPVINGVAVTRGNSWCFACHNNTNDWFGAGYPSPATPSRDASGYPVSGRFFGPVTYNNAAANAHTSIPASSGAFRQRGDCLYCHQSHRSANRYDALRATYRPPSPATLASDQAQGAYAETCFACHGGVTQSYFTTRPVNIRQFVVNPSTASTVNAGHRIETPGGTLPVGSPLPCYNCHNPHGSTRGNASLISDERGRLLGTSTAAGVRAFCLTCHSTNDGFVWNSVTATYTTVSTTETVEGLRRDGTGGNRLRIPSTAGHVRADTQSCYVCHDQSYATGGSNVHNPAKPSNRLFFKPVLEESVTGNVPTGDQGQTYAGGTWRVRSMSPASSTVAFESFDTATVTVSAGTTQNWRRVRFVSPTVATTVTVPSAAWTVSIFSRESSVDANAFMRPFIYVWRADNATRVNIVGPADIGAEFVTTALPGGLQTVATPAGVAVELRPGDKVVMDLAVQTRAPTAGSYAMTYSWGLGAQGSLLAPVAVTWRGW